MESTQAVRTAIYQAIGSLSLDGKVIPVFDGVVNPNISIPSIRGAASYIVLQDQQENLSPLQNMCSERNYQNITIRVPNLYPT